MTKTWNTSGVRQVTERDLEPRSESAVPLLPFHAYRAVLSAWRKVLSAVTPSLLTINKVMCRGHNEWSSFQSYRRDELINMNISVLTT